MGQVEVTASSPPITDADVHADSGARTVAPTRLIPIYVSLLCAATGVIVLLSDFSPIGAEPWLFALLVAAVVILDAVRIDVFERANLSPASVPELALAFFMGPIGPIVAEAGIALVRAVRRDPPLKWCFDFGALSLAGTAAALTFDAFPNAHDGQLLAVGALAGAAYYVVNSGLLAIVMALAEGRGPIGVWRERLAWMTPHYVAFGILAATFVIAELGLGLYAIAAFALPVVMLWIAEKQYLDRSRATVTGLRAGQRSSSSQRTRSSRVSSRRIASCWDRCSARTCQRSPRLRARSRPRIRTRAATPSESRTSRCVLAADLGFDESKLPAINVGAIIHDIGKIGVPDAILLKPGPLDPDEFAEMRRHPEMSSYIVGELDLPIEVKQMVSSHHERYDGRGYPDRLVGERIPLAARILTVADALDAMTSDRPYRNALPLEIALEEIRAKSGTQFCPSVVAALDRVMVADDGLRTQFAAPEVVDEDVERSETSKKLSVSAKS